MKKTVFVFLLLFITQITSAQQTDNQKVTKENSVVTLESFLQQVATTHPLVKQAQLLSDMGKQEIRLARGLFDPKFMSDFEMKDFKDKLYYQNWTNQLKIPTWVGVDIKAGYDRNRGDFLNPESKLPDAGLEYLGVTVPVGQGLFIDQRRAALREAQYAKEILEAERIKLINKTILQITKDYLEWYASYRQYEIALKGYELAKVRFEGIVDRVLQGDAAGIDSVEAKITFQDREISLQKANLELQNSRLLISNHLWAENGEPQELSPEHQPAMPILSKRQSVEELVTYAKENHPELLKLKFKTSQLEVQRRLAIEMLKPVIDVNYNFLGLSGRTGSLDYMFANNYKWGFHVAFPLFFRKERAKLQQTKIKLSQINFENNFANRQIINDINMFSNELNTYTKLLQQQDAVLKNQELLVKGEVEKFQNGESSLFLVNSRESKMLEIESKLVDTQAKFVKSYASLLWAAGKTIGE